MATDLPKSKKRRPPRHLEQTDLEAHTVLRGHCTRENQGGRQGTFKTVFQKLFSKRIDVSESDSDSASDQSNGNGGNDFSDFNQWDNMESHETAPKIQEKRTRKVRKCVLTYGHLLIIFRHNIIISKNMWNVSMTFFLDCSAMKQ